MAYKNVKEIDVVINWKEQNPPVYDFAAAMAFNIHLGSR